MTPTSFVDALKQIDLASCGNGEDGTCRQTDTEKDRQKLLFDASTICLNYDSKIRA